MLLECVPNFSEGKDLRVLAGIREEICAVPGIRFLGMDVGKAAHRTVMTFVGPPAAVTEAAFRAIRQAWRTIDMAAHHGVHPRLGSVDVCPLIPLKNMTFADAVACARRLAQRTAEELSLPVFLYEKAADPQRPTRLADIRMGQYEGIAERVREGSFRPDFGPARFDPRFGAAVIGVRDLMVAYNINLEGDALKAARRIAGRIRESGYRARRVRRPGMFPGLRALGWYIADFDRVQVSTNIMDIRKASIHRVFRAVCELGQTMGTRVLGSELVGMVPQRVLREAGAFFAAEAGHNPADLSRADLTAAAVAGLGLAAVKPFVAEDHILEAALGEEVDLGLQ